MTQVLYNNIGNGYNNTRQADPYIAAKLCNLLHPAPSGMYLDIGCGTGNYTKALAALGLEMYGIDPSEKMLAIAETEQAQITWIQGTAGSIPLAGNTFDGITAVLTIHHWTDLDASFAELSRVLKPGGKIVLFTSTPVQMNGYWLHHYFPAMMHNSVQQMPALAKIEAAAERAGLKNIHTYTYSVKDDLQDHFLYVGKHNPELYFDETIRDGISSFVTLSNAEETKKGLDLLRADLDSNSFPAIKTQYENTLGDYIFVTLTNNGV